MCQEKYWVVNIGLSTLKDFIVKNYKKFCNLDLNIPFF